MDVDVKKYDGQVGVVRGLDIIPELGVICELVPGSMVVGDIKGVVVDGGEGAMAMVVRRCVSVLVMVGERDGVLVVEGVLVDGGVDGVDIDGAVVVSG